VREGEYWKEDILKMWPENTRSAKRASYFLPYFRKDTKGRKAHIAVTHGIFVEKFATENGQDPAPWVEYCGISCLQYDHSKKQVYWKWTRYCL
jgi:hypothetical protein